MSHAAGTWITATAWSWAELSVAFAAMCGKPAIWKDCRVALCQGDEILAICNLKLVGAPDGCRHGGKAVHPSCCLCCQAASTSLVREMLCRILNHGARADCPLMLSLESEVECIRSFIASSAVGDYHRPFENCMLHPCAHDLTFA